MFCALLLWLACGEETCLLQRQMKAPTWPELVDMVQHQQQELEELEERVSHMGRTSIINSTAFWLDFKRRSKGFWPDLWPRLHGQRQLP